MRRWLLLLGLLAAVGCEDELPRASLIQYMRVLGARSEVVGDPSRSNPHPGEAAQLTWDIAYPRLDEDDSRLQSMFLVCTAPVRFSGIPICQEIIDAAGSVSEDTPPFGLGAGTGVLSCGSPELKLVGDAVGCVDGTPKQLIGIGE